jgi:exopolysaccharide biosynthesis polyprenyl glycosylphosphotransferase
MDAGGRGATTDVRPPLLADTASVASVVLPSIAGGSRQPRTSLAGEHSGAAGGRWGVGTHRHVRRRWLIVAQLVAIDLAAATTAVALAFPARSGFTNVGLERADFIAATLLPPLWICASALNRGYDLRFVAVGSGEFGNLARAFMHITVLTAFVSYAGNLNLARGLIVPALPLALLLSCAGRYAGRLRLRRMRRTGRALHRVLGVGTAGSILRLAASMQRDPTAGLRIVGACLPEHELDSAAVRDDLAAAEIGVCGSYAVVPRAVGLCAAGSVAVVAGDVGTELLRTISWGLERSEADLIVCTGLSEVVDRRVHVQSIAGLPLLRVDTPCFRGFRRVLKGGFDRAVAAVALVVLAPLMLAIAVLIRCTSPGPAFYRQRRIGRHGRPFRIFKFRTMQCGADDRLADLISRNEADGGLLFKIHDDPRVTRVGRVLRHYSLDELPQLFNVLTGSMSLVGPRPPLPVEVARYDGELSRRLLVKPGVTGLWQVSGRSDLPWEEAVRLDLHYVENWSLALDMAVLLKTPGAVVKAHGAY